MKKFKVYVFGHHEWERVFEVEAEDVDDAENKADTLFMSIYGNMADEEIKEEISLHQNDGELLGVEFVSSDNSQDKDYDVEKVIEDG